MEEAASRLADGRETDEGIEEIRRGLAQYIATGAELWLPDFLTMHAEAHKRAGQAAAGPPLESRRPRPSGPGVNAVMKVEQHPPRALASVGEREEVGPTIPEYGSRGSRVETQARY